MQALYLQDIVIKKDQSYGIIPLRDIEGECHVFLIKHLEGEFWAFPKGHAEKGESEQETAVRECLEETGLTVVNFVDENPISEAYTFEWDGTKIHKTVIYFIAYVAGEPNLQIEEVLEGRWLSLDEAENLATFPESRRIIAEVKRRAKSW